MVRTRISFDGAPGPWFWLLLALAVLLLILQYRRLSRTAPPGARALLMLTRAVLAAAILACLLRPTIQKQKLAPLEIPLPILVDTSRSMSLPYGGSESRLDAARVIINKLAGRRVRGLGEAAIYAFDETVRLVAASEMPGLEARGSASDITAAMASMAGREGPGVKILVLTDGRQNSEKTALPADGRFVIVGIGSREPLKDIRVADLKVADMGFQGKPVEVAAVIRGEGYGEQSVPVSLKVDGKLVSLRTVAVPADGEKEVIFQWTPQATGSFQVAVESKAPPDDRVPANNSREATVKVARDRIRVLFICGSPTWNYRFLREALKRDPSLDLISFIILRSPTDFVDVPQNELSLIPFPTDKLFNEELQNFDLIIFDNFSYRFYFPPEYLARLKERVREGGAFWMWGGPLSFINGAYRGTPVEEMLPFSLEGPPVGEGYLQQSFRAQFTPGAGASPLFSAEVRGPGGESVWRELPRLAGFNIVGPVREGSTVLVENPAYQVGGRPQPLIAMRAYGRGRVMAVATDYLWYWDFVAAGGGQSNKLYLEFVKNAVRWLTGDPFLSPVRLTVSPESAAAGDMVTVRVRVVDDHFKPVDNPSLDLSVQTPRGEKVSLRAAPSGVAGVYEVRYRLPVEGGYRFAVSAAGAGGNLGSDMALLSAADFQKEISSPGLDETYLRDLAAASGGEYLTYAEGRDFDERLARALNPRGESTRILSEERIGVGNLPLTFAFLLVTLALDWTIRKRYRVE